MFSLLMRYLVIVLLGAFNLAAFYFIFTPLTVYPVFWIISIFDDNSGLLAGNLIFFKGDYAEIIPACVAGAAYYLLTILNLSTPMENKKRIRDILFLFGSFLVLNITRILIFLALFAYGFSYFDITHILTWYFGSTLMVVLIWFFSVWIFKIKEIPVYSDIRRIMRDVVKK